MENIAWTSHLHEILEPRSRSTVQACGKLIRLTWLQSAVREHPPLLHGMK